MKRKSNLVYQTHDSPQDTLSKKPKHHYLVTFLLEFLDWFFFNMPPGPKIVKVSFVVNSQKVLMPIYLIFLIKYYENYSDQMILYSIMHGSYGIFWYMKHVFFPDKFSDFKFTITCAITTWMILLGPYMVPAWLIASRNTMEIVDKKWLYSWLLVYIFGVVLTLCSDAQKNITLQFIQEHNLYKGKQFLITEGFFKHCRNPNFLGEMMMYFSFAAVCNHWVAYSIVIYSWLTILAARIFQKEISLMSKPGWEQYAQQSWLLIPKINGRTLDSIIFYSILGFSIYILVGQ
ncbi:duf1295 domain containing protein [Stylonychia lemnae]|uniref:Duf1295 domain containing protein n=1 Tax=Stylonychia lemnae TaxID=5949 RepID=A0A078AWM3_STYLE|nr:duf1295 domain containing protein [Stylonychia lemnae]|eukprot:CDW85208.1 duf1295 domain containing protein [Stylonychia lemnae]